jgi:hypothetical protein
MSEKGNEVRLKPGAKLVPVATLFVGLLSLPEAIKLLKSDSALNGSGFFPVLICAVIMLLSIVEIIKESKQRSESADRPLKERIVAAIRYLLPRDVLFMIVLVILYCVALGLGAGFAISTTVFLLASMMFYIRNKLLKNVVYTAVIMVAVIVVFKMVFSVVLP